MRETARTGGNNGALGSLSDLKLMDSSDPVNEERDGDNRHHYRIREDTFFTYAGLVRDIRDNGFGGGGSLKGSLTSSQMTHMNAHAVWDQALTYAITAQLVRQSLGSHSSVSTLHRLLVDLAELSIYRVGVEDGINGHTVKEFRRQRREIHERVTQFEMEVFAP